VQPSAVVTVDPMTSSRTVVGATRCHPLVSHPWASPPSRGSTMPRGPASRWTALAKRRGWCHAGAEAMGSQSLAEAWPAVGRGISGRGHRGRAAAGWRPTSRAAPRQIGGETTRRLVRLGGETTRRSGTRDPAGMMGGGAGGPAWRHSRRRHMDIMIIIQ